MANKPKSPAAMILALTLIASGSGLALASMSEFTKAAIDQARQADLKANLDRILPAHANAPDEDVVVVDDQGKELQVYVAKDAAGKVVGAAFEVVGKKGYGGAIRILLGIDANEHITGYYVLEHKETPGLGDKASKDDPESDRDFADQFKGKGLDNMKFAVRKDGGEVDAITSATITSRAVTGALAAGLERFHRIRARLRKGGAK